MSFTRVLYVMSLLVLLVFCRKESGVPKPGNKDPEQRKKILLKDIVVPRLPSPYYHFEYGADSLVSKANFASGFLIYDVLYNSGKIGEMRNNIIVNHDTLRYVYDNTDRLASVAFITDDNIVNRHVKFSYNGEKVSQINWDRLSGNGAFVVDRTLTFTYHQDGNLKEMNENRPLDDLNYSTHFDDYDDKLNVDDFTLIHDGIHDHFLVLPELNLQKNNPRKVWLSGAANNYIVTYKYDYNSDGTPVQKSGELIFTSGSQVGQKFNVGTGYSYY